jgi:AP-3 complex subunit delta-1
VILLTTNLFRKEIRNSTNQYEAALAINCIANIATFELARDCLSDLVIHLSLSKPYLRKKALLAVYKLILKFPSGLSLFFEKLKETLEDSDISVVSTAVNVICELAKQNPKSFVNMAPIFFKLLTTTSNNWMLIKLVKLLTSLMSEEPRLARKLLDPLTAITQNTNAKSLKYECIFALTEALSFSKREDGTNVKSFSFVSKLCSDYLRGFVEDSDQNLKYLGLVGLCNLLKSSLKLVVEHRDLVLQCLNDEDYTIRSKSLEILVGIVSRKSLIELVKHLMQVSRSILFFVALI